MPHTPKENLIGKKFNRLSVVGYVPGSKRKSAKWKCVCDCGKITYVEKYELVNGYTKSCGCYNLELLKSRKRHGLNKHPLAYVLQAMKQRCYNQAHPEYHNYGARGISVCDEWKDSLHGVENFVNWALQNGYKTGLSIDRIDVNGDYCPENCRWATAEEQTLNRRNTKIVEYKGETKPLIVLCRELGVDYDMITKRLRLGWSVEKALETPKDTRYVRTKH